MIVSPCNLGIWRYYTQEFKSFYTSIITMIKSKTKPNHNPPTINGNNGKSAYELWKETQYEYTKNGLLFKIFNYLAGKASTNGFIKLSQNLLNKNGGVFRKNS